MPVTPTPPGLHRAVISGVESDLTSKSGAYRMAKVVFSILTMGCAGAKVVRWYMVGKASPEAKDFPVTDGRKNLSALFEACKKPIAPPSTLLGSTLRVIVSHKANDAGGHWAIIDSVMPDDPSTCPPSVPPTPSFSDDGMPF